MEIPSFLLDCLPVYNREGKNARKNPGCSFLHGGFPENRQNEGVSQGFFVKKRKKANRALHFAGRKNQPKPCGAALVKNRGVMI
jgi:hypothetical protein